MRLRWWMIAVVAALFLWQQASAQTVSSPQAFVFIPLAIPAGPAGIPSDSFRLRPSEIRRIPICSRLDGQRNPLQIYFAADSPLRQAPDFAFGEIGLAILGEATELHEKLHLSVRDNGVLEVSRVV